MVKSGLRTGLLRSHSNRGEWALDISEASEDKPYGRALGQGHFGEKRQGSYGLVRGCGWQWHMASLPLVKDFDYGPGSGDSRDCQAFLTPKGQIHTFTTACVHPKSSPMAWPPGLALPDRLILFSRVFSAHVLV